MSDAIPVIPTTHTSTEARIVQLGVGLGFSAVGIADIALEREAEGFQAWVAAGRRWRDGVYGPPW